MLTPRDVAELIFACLPEPGPGYSGDLQLERMLTELYNPIGETDRITGRETLVRLFLSQVGVELKAKRLWRSADRRENELADAQRAAEDIARAKVARAHGRKPRKGNKSRRN